MTIHHIFEEFEIDFSERWDNLYKINTSSSNSGNTLIAMMSNGGRKVIGVRVCCKTKI